MEKHTGLGFAGMARGGRIILWVVVLCLFVVVWGAWNKSSFILLISLSSAFFCIGMILLRMKADCDRRTIAEEQLQSSDAKYRTLIENVSAVIYSTDLSGRIDFASPGVRALTGYGPEEINSQHFSFLVDTVYLPKVYKHYQSQLSSLLQETTLEFPMITRTGKRKWVEQIALLLLREGKPVGFQCLVRDITDRKQLEEELEAYEFRLRENQLLLQSILDNTNALIYVKSLDGKYRVVNKRFLEVFQLSESEVINHTDFDFNNREQARHYNAQDEDILRTGHPIETEERLQTANGTLHLLLIKFPLRDKDHHIMGISGIATDITERVQYQEQLIAAKTEAEDARKMQEQFLANMSHEIRTPMNGIQGMTNLLLETALSAQQQEFAEVIRLSVNNLLVIINDILDFSKIKAGKLSIEKIDFRLNDVVSNVRSLFDHRLYKKGLEFILEVDPLVPEWMQGDPHRLNQVLINLVGNAIKFTEKGQITLSVKVKARSTNEINLLFTVMDTGIGIPEKSIPVIFDSFTQAGSDTSRRFGGTGLGLAISHQLLELQGGHISVSSQEHKGSSFYFCLTYGCREPNNVSQQVKHSIRDFEGFLAGKHFLIVEDNPVNQKLIEHVLLKGGADVTLAGHGQEAIAELEIKTFDLIIMDLQMPVMDGYETTCYIRNRLQLRTPILAMTANVISGEQVRCLQAGMNDYMSKPFEFREFYMRVAELLRAPAAGSVAVSQLPGTTLSYNLSLLEEVGDEEYLQDVLNTFLLSLPLRVDELVEANDEKDFAKLFFIAHSLKGSVGMMQATGLIEELNRIELSAKEKTDVADIVREVMNLSRELSRQLETEKRRRKDVNRKAC